MRTNRYPTESITVRLNMLPGILAAAENDGNTVTLTLEAGSTYTVGESQTEDEEGTFTVTIAP